MTYPIYDATEGNGAVQQTADYGGRMPSDWPYPWERKMTVCIAAVAKYKDEAAIIFCNDWRKQSFLGSSDTVLKFDFLGKHWCVLFSGDVSEAHLLIRSLKTEVKAAETIEDHNLRPILDAAVARRKKELCDHLTQSRYGIPYEELLKIGKDKFPPEEFRDAMSQIRQLNLGSELIVFGFSGDSPNICIIRKDGKISLHEDCAVIGEGEILASAELMSRQHDSVVPFMEGLYNVYSAKRAASVLGSVSESQTISVLLNENRVLDPSKEVIQFIKDIYKKHHIYIQDSEFKYSKSFGDVTTISEVQ